MRARSGHLQEMVDAGFITREEAMAAISNPVDIKPSDYVPATQYIVDYAGEILPQLVAQYDESIVVWTTIDGESQAHAEKALRDRLNEEGTKLGASQGALVMLDTGGAIKAMVGGKSYAKSQFNRVTKAKRQPGSAFKPFVYLAALEQGFSPYSMEIDGPIKIGDWEPENYRQKYLGPVTLTKALALSLNTVAARLVMKVTPEAVDLGRASPRHHIRAHQQRLDRAWHVGSDAARTDIGLRAVRQWRHAGRALSHLAHHDALRPDPL